MITTRTITVTLNDFDGTLLESARVEISLVGFGNGVAGAVAPGSQEKKTDSSGVASFKLWQNEQQYSDTYYEITSYHPETGRVIHNREIFFVGDSDDDVKNLIGVSPARLDRIQELVNESASLHAEVLSIFEQIKVMYDALEGNAHPVIYNQTITVVAGVARAVRLGAIRDSDDELLTYSAGSNSNIDVNGHLAIIDSDSVGQQTITVTVSDQSSNTDSAILTVNTIAASSVTEYTLNDVSVS